MRRHWLVVIVVLLSVILGCMGNVGDTKMVSTSLSPPWVDMNLPVADGTVLYSDEMTCTVSHVGSVPTVSHRYAEAIVDSGWSLVHELSSEEAVSKTFERQTQQVALSVLEDATDQVVVTVTRLDF